MATMNLAVLGEQHVERFGDYPVAVFKDIERTNTELLSRAQRLAGALAEVGVEPGDRVAVMLPNSMEVATAYGAILRAGGVVVPMVFLLAVPEIAHILADAEPKAIFTSPEFVGNVRAAMADLASPPRVILVGEAGAGDDVLVHEDLIEGGTPLAIVERAEDDLAVISYTSGTTGRPKGVMLTHANLLFQATNSAAVSALKDGDVSLSCLPLAHLFGLGNTLVAQLFRIRAVILEWFTPAGVFDAVQRYRVTSTAFVPTMVSMMIADPGFDEVDWSSLEYAVIGAAPLPMEVAREFERRTGARALQGYGLTETSPAVSLLRMEDPTNGSAGKPVPNVEVQIRDDEGRALGPDEPGEICVRGPNVMAGYYKLPEATAEAIRDGWFHTGDIGYLDADGYLTITDRKKDLIIRGGFNVYPSDVEDVLHRHPAVQSAGVVGVPDATMGEEVKAFVVLRPGAVCGEEELLAHCRAHLATYKTPRWITITDSLPMTAVGKILRKELRARASAEADAPPGALESGA